MIPNEIAMRLGALTTGVSNFKKRVDLLEKGGPGSGRKAADAASKKAATASAHANLATQQANSKPAHREAAVAHSNAASAHLKAAIAHGNLSGAAPGSGMQSTTQSLYHDKAAADHMKAEAVHRSKGG